MAVNFLGIGRGIGVACPTAFGEVNYKPRLTK